MHAKYTVSSITKLDNEFEEITGALFRVCLLPVNPKLPLKIVTLKEHQLIGYEVGKSVMQFEPRVR